MKTKINLTVRFILLVLMLTPTLPIFATNSKQSYKIINGVIYDAQSKKGLDYATLTAKESNISTVANEDGVFSLKINDTIDVKEIEISRMGYQSQTILLEDKESQDIKVYLIPISKQLQEIVVVPEDALEIVKKAITKIGDNYSPNNNLMTGFYRETAQKRGTYITVAEAIFNIYKTPYNQGIANDRVQVLKGRTLLSPKISDTIVVKAQGGPNIAKYLDLVKNQDLMLSPKTIEFYKYTFEKTISINERPHYVIDFEPQVTVPYALYYGKLYIDKENLTFSRAELYLSTDDKDKAADAVLVKKPSSMRFQVNSLTSIITYKVQNGRSYLNYINNEIKFKCNWKKWFYIFAPTYTITSEVVITDRNENDANKIPYKQAFSEKQTLSDKIQNFYDPNFWEAYNIIEPTESLESAVNKLKKQNQE